MRPHLLLIFLTIATGWAETTSLSGGDVSGSLGGGAVANGRVHEQPTPGQDAAGSAPTGAAATVSGALERLADHIPPASADGWVNGRFSLTKGDVIVFTGPENVVLEQQNGWLESLLAAHWKEAGPRFRHMGWEGDTVYRQNRMDAWGTWQENLDAAGAAVVIAWFGQLEAFEETKSASDFGRAYGRLLDDFAKRTPRIVVIGPAPFEKPADPRIPDNTPRNVRVREHSKIARQLAVQRGFIFVDLFAVRQLTAPAVALTRDGLHFHEAGHRDAARMIAANLGAAAGDISEPLRAAVVEKNRLWFDTWRCMNWAFAYGDRTRQPFAMGADGKPRLTDELKQYQPLLKHADAVVHALAAGKPAPARLPGSPLRADPPAPSPEEEMSRFNVRDGFSVNLFADERLGLVRPLQIRWDERGRLWVACAPAYPQLQPGEHGNDCIIILEDTDNDGRADRGIRFAEKLTLPMGFEFAPRAEGGGIYVCESTRLVHLPDADGDSRAERARVVLSGFGTGDTHQNANSLRWGPDGCLWFTQGYHIWSYVETPHGIRELNRSGIWRYNPRTRRLDSFLNESTAGLNCWGTAWDDWGQVFHGSGADYHIWHTAPATVPTLHPLPLPTRLALSRGKSMEPEFLGSSHLPEDLRGALLKSTYFTGQVQLYRLSDDGSSFASEDLGDLVSSSTNEFRPVESRVGPDGAIYVCDWLNPVIGHYQASYRDPRRDRSHGRIWRIAASGRPLVSRINLAELPPEALVERLRSPERYERDRAQQLLYRLEKAAVISAADAVRGQEPGVTADSARLLYELSGVFAAHEEARPDIIEKLLASDDFRWRSWAARLCGVWAEKLRDPLALLQRAIADPHPRVRMEAVVACSWMPAPLGPDAVKLATLAMELPVDPGIDHALTLCIHALAPQWRPALAAGRLDFGNRFHALAKILTTVGEPGITSRLRSLLQEGKFTGSARESLLAVLVEQGSPEDAAFAIAQAPDSPAVLDALVAAARSKRDAGYGTVLRQLLDSPHLPARIAGCRAVGGAGQDFGTMPRLQEIAGSALAATTERSAAIAAIAQLRGKASLPELLRFADSDNAELRAAAFAALAPLDPNSVASRSVRLLAKAASTAEVAPLFHPLLGQQGGAEILATALEREAPPPDQARLALQWMGESGRDDAVLRQALNHAAGISGGIPEYSEEIVRKLAVEAAAKGDAQRGLEVFKATQSTCLACHKIGAEGGVLGPDLSVVGRAMTPEMIVESVLWPKRQVKEGFLLTAVTLKDGRTVQGYRQGETEETLSIKEVGTAVTQPLSKSGIATRTDAGTLMPDGLTAWMSAEQRLDLLKFLFQQGR
ncbi:MAG: hypothetical protein KA004_11460 [Verrucomicrobiales bacterium]|nr:hypothetical protein [Verrucomicrobiales bacterium]